MSIKRVLINNVTLKLGNPWLLLLSYLVGILVHLTLSPKYFSSPVVSLSPTHGWCLCVIEASAHMSYPQKGQFWFIIWNNQILQPLLYPPSMPPTSSYQLLSKASSSCFIYLRLLTFVFLLIISSHSLD